MLQKVTRHSRAGPAEARFADDVWISGLLARWGIPRLVVPLLPVDDAESRGMQLAQDGGLTLEYMFRHVWRQVGSQERALKGHPERAVRNRATVLFFSDLWGRPPV